MKDTTAEGNLTESCRRLDRAGGIQDIGDGELERVQKEPGSPRKQEQGVKVSFKSVSSTSTPI